MAERFYINCPLAVEPIILEGPEAHHLTTVCRLRPGDEVCLFNGDGRQYPAKVTALGRRSVTLQVHAIEAPQRKLGFRLEIAAPLPKGDRAQFLVEKLTELGVTALVPLHTGRSVVHPRETRLEKLHRYVIEASKQCGRNMLMHIDSLADWEAYCCRSDLPSLKIVAHPGGMRYSWPKPQDVVAAVGPEGGFTEEEIAVARSAGWQVIDLGPRILRVETAALVMAAWLAR